MGRFSPLGSGPKLNIEGNVAQAHHLGRLVSAAADLELLTPVTLNLVTFRYVPTDGASPTEDALDALNVEILLRLQERGIAVPSSSRVNGKYALRVAITNHRTRFEDLSILVNAVQQIGREIGSE